MNTNKSQGSISNDNHDSAMNSRRSSKFGSSTQKLKYLGIGIVAVLLVAYIYYSNRDDEQVNVNQSTIKGKVKTEEEELDDLEKGRVDTSFEDDVTKRNQMDAEAAKEAGESHVDKFVGGIATDLQPIHDRMDGFDGSITDINDKLDALALQLSEKERRQSSYTKVKEEDNYIGLDGVTYRSQNYAEKYETSIANALDKINGARTIAISGEVNANRNRGLRRNRFSNRANNNQTQPSPFDIRAGNAYEVIPVSNELHIAQMNIALNSVIGGHVMATIMSGEHQGTVLIANNFNATRHHLIIEFNRFCLEDGSCGPIKAVAVDIDERVSAIRGKRKGFYGLRILGTTATSLLRGFGRAYSRNLATGNVVVSDGVVIQEERDNLETEEALRAAALEVGNDLSSIVREMTTRPPEVSTKVDELIGLHVLSPGVISRVDPRYSTYTDSGVASNTGLNAPSAGLGAINNTNLGTGFGTRIGRNLNQQFDTLQQQQAQQFQNLQQTTQ